MQIGQTPLQVAIDKDSHKVVYLLVVKSNVQISNLSQVSSMSTFTYASENT